MSFRVKLRPWCLCFEVWFKIKGQGDVLLVQEKAIIPNNMNVLFYAVSFLRLCFQYECWQLFISEFIM
jgi:hypothetical protein